MEIRRRQIAPTSGGGEAGGDTNTNDVIMSKVDRALRSRISRPSAIAIELAGANYNLWQRLTPGQWLRTTLVPRANTNGGNVHIIKEYRLVSPVLIINDNDPGITYAGTWTPGANAAAYGGDYRHASTPADSATWTSPAATTRLGAKVVLNTNGGLARVTINGDPTRARLLPTAQDLVERGVYPATILVSGGGALASTDRVVDCYASAVVWDSNVLLADDLPPAAHIVKITATGYQRAAATGARTYLGGLFSGQAQLIGAAGATAVQLNRVESEFESATEYAIQGSPSAGSNQQFMGCIHDNEAQDSISVTVDDTPTTLTDATPVFPVSTATIHRTSHLLHPSATGAVANIVTDYTIDRDGITVAVSVTWLQAFRITAAYSMLPVSGTLTTQNDRSRFDRGDLLEHASGPLRLGTNPATDTFNGQSKSAAAWMWESRGRLAAGIYIENIDAFTNGWAPAAGSRLACIEDRNGIVSKIYISRVGQGSSSEDVVNGTVWTWRAHYLFGSQAAPEQTFA